MWPIIDRARRRLSVGSTAPVDIPPVAPVVESACASASPESAPEDVVIILGRPDVRRLCDALHQALGSTMERPDTPDGIACALTQVLERNRAPGRARVLRQPAAVSTPESWEIHLDGVDRATVTAVRDASRPGRLVS